MRLSKVIKDQHINRLARLVEAKRDMIGYIEHNLADDIREKTPLLTSVPCCSLGGMLVRESLMLALEEGVIAYYRSETGLLLGLERY